MRLLSAGNKRSNSGCLGFDMKSHVSEQELSAINSSGLNFSVAPAIIRGVSSSQLSVARHYGGCRAFGRHYVYVPTTDELIRDDVVRLLAKIRKVAVKAKNTEMAKKQQSLFG